MNSRTRNIIILILSLAIGGGFLFYVINKNEEFNHDSTILPEAFIPVSVNGYAVFNFNALRNEIKEEIKDVDGGFLITLSANQFIAENLSYLNKDKACAFSHLSDSTGPYGVFVGQLYDSLADMQQSGFVLRKRLLKNQVFAGQFKNLLIAIVSDSSMNEGLALRRANDYIKEEKRDGITYDSTKLIGNVLNQSNIHPKNVLTDSFSFELIYANNELVLNPFYNLENNQAIFKTSQTKVSFGADSLRNQVSINANASLFISVTNKFEKVQNLREKFEALGLDLKLLENAWNGAFVYQDLGNKTITNSFITYEMDDEFNTIEVEKKTEKEISAFAIAIGVPKAKQHDVFNELLNHKLIKEKGDNYTLINVMDSEVEFREEGDYFILSNIPGITFEKEDTQKSSSIHWNIKGKVLDVLMNKDIIVRY